MKTKKGFTLIELLAVIVILAIIALIATPIIMGVIDDAQKGADRETANRYLDAVEYQISLELVSNPTADLTSIRSKYLTTVHGSIVSGKKPTSVSLIIDENGVIGTGSIVKVGSTVFTVQADGSLSASN